MKNHGSLTKELSDFVIRSPLRDFPGEVIEMSKMCFLDWLGVTFGGMKNPSVQILIDIVKEMGGKKQATVLGYGMKTNILNAALVNGTMSHALDFDDAHSGSRSHASAPLIPALLAMSEYKKLSGSDLITSFIVGFEVSKGFGMIA